MEIDSSYLQLIKYVYYNEYELAEKMLRENKDNLYILFTNNYDNAFMEACYFKKTKFIKLFLSYLNNKKYDKIISYRNTNGITALMRILDSNINYDKTHKLVWLLLKTNKSHPEYVTKSNYNALMFGVESLEYNFTESKKILEILLETGYSHPEIKNSRYNRSIEIVNYL